MSCLREEKKKKKKQREKSAVDFNATITRSSFQVHIGGEVNEISERRREGGRERSTAFISATSRLYTKMQQVLAPEEEFWANIDPVNMCAVHTLPVFLPFLSPPLGETHPPCRRHGS